MEHALESEHQQNTLAERVTVRMREAIFRGEFRPGERLSEPELAKLLGVSRSPVREAMHLLTKERLLERHTNRRCYVWSPTETDVDEIFSLRVMLESLASERVIDTLVEDDFRSMEMMIEEQRQFVEAGQFIDLIHADKSFHEFLCVRANHSLLLSWWRQIMGQWGVLIYRGNQNNPGKTFPRILIDHTDLLEAYRQRDLACVLQLHKGINNQVVEQIQEILRQQQHPMNIHVR